MTILEYIYCKGNYRFKLFQLTVACSYVQLYVSERARSHTRGQTRRCSTLASATAQRESVWLDNLLINCCHMISRIVHRFVMLLIVIINSQRLALRVLYGFESDCVGWTIAPPVIQDSSFSGNVIKRFKGSLLLLIVEVLPHQIFLYSVQN